MRIVSDCKHIVWMNLVQVTTSSKIYSENCTSNWIHLPIIKPTVRRHIGRREEIKYRQWFSHDARVSRMCNVYVCVRIYLSSRNSRYIPVQESKWVVSEGYMVAHWESRKNIVITVIMLLSFAVITSCEFILEVYTFLYNNISVAN